jgi:hypothetical protein
MPLFRYRFLTLCGLSLIMLLVVLSSGSGCGSTQTQPSVPTPVPTSISTSVPTSVPTAVPTTPPTPVTSISRPLLAVPSSSIPLSGEWRFATDPDGVGETEGWVEPGFDDSSWVVVDVPHTWNVMAGYADYEGVAWYRRTFTLPAEAEDAHLRLHFNAAFYLARVWLNGEYLGEHEGGYTPFEFDVSGIAKPGTENVIAVQADNLRATDRIPATLRPDWSFDWWNYGGIVRDVSLHAPSSLASKSLPSRTSSQKMRPIRRRSPPG